MKWPNKRWTFHQIKRALGIIATNYHVVDNAHEIKIVVKDGTEVKSYVAKELVTDKTNDLALVSITDKEFNGVRDIPYSLYLDTKEVGTSIFSMGYPMSNILGGEVKITDGIINSKTGYEGDIATYQISSPIQLGKDIVTIYSVGWDLLKQSVIG